MVTNPNFQSIALLHDEQFVQLHPAMVPVLYRQVAPNGSLRVHPISKSELPRSTLLLTLRSPSG